MDEEWDFSKVVTSTRAEDLVVQQKGCECGSFDLLHDEPAGVVVCQDCGVVAEKQFITEQRERDLKNDDGTSKTLQRTETDDISGNFSTSIGGQTDMYRLQEQQSENPEQKKLRQLRKTAQELCLVLSAPDQTKKETLTWVDAFALQPELSRENKTVLVCALMHGVCNGEIMSIREICQAAKIATKKVHNCYLSLKKLPLYKKMRKQKQGCVNQMSKHCSDLKLPFSFTSKAEEVARRVYQFAIGEGKKPGTLAGAILLLLLEKHENPEHRRDIASIAHVVGRGKDPIRKCYQNDIEKNRSRLLGLTSPARSPKYASPRSPGIQRNQHPY
jgi:transcription initiation factor TFIIIB Brf1 subunit/transcription initiation factor TFIIB